MSEFRTFLSQIRYGQLDAELSDDLQELTKACTETGKAGTLTVTFKMKPGRSGQMEITDTVKVKLPEFEQGSTLLFSTPDGHLQREDPRQITMELKVVDDAPRGEPRRVV